MNRTTAISKFLEYLENNINSVNYVIAEQYPIIDGYISKFDRSTHPATLELRKKFHEGISDPFYVDFNCVRTITLVFLPELSKKDKHFHFLPK